MTTQNGVTTVCIDIGMKGAAAYWKHDDIRPIWKPLFGTFKVPTRLIYDVRNEDDPYGDWDAEPAGFDPIPQEFTVTRQWFKIFMDEKGVSNLNPALRAQFPRPKVHRWMQDYIRLLCTKIFSEIEKALHQVNWKDGEVRCIFTFPGSWAEDPTQADFKRLAENAVSASIGENHGSKVAIKFTEAEASAQFLLDAGSKASLGVFDEGKIILSCDIGGATTDIAIIRLGSERLLRQGPQVDLCVEGDMKVDLLFQLHVQQHLESVGVPGSSRIAQKLVQTKFRDVKKNFTGKLSENWIAISLDSIHGTTWPAAGITPAKETRIESWEGTHYLQIHKETMIGFFTEFLKNIEDGINAAIMKMDEKNKYSLDAIGICGGGSYMAYPVEHLRQRYKDKTVTFMTHRDYESAPEFATVLGCTILHNQRIVRDYCAQICVGIKSAHGAVFWGNFIKFPKPCASDEPFTMEVRFPTTTHSVRDTKRNRLVVVPHHVGNLPHKFSEAQKIPQSKTLEVTVDLRHAESLPSSWEKRYNVICSVSGFESIKVMAKAGEAGKEHRIDVGENQEQ